MSDFFSLSFQLNWGLVNGSRLTVRSVALEFAANVFPPATEDDTEMYPDDALIYALQFASPQSA